MAAQHKRSIRNFFINRELQGRISLAVFVSVIAVCVIFFVLLAFFSKNTLTFSYSDNMVQVGRTPWMLLKDALLANWLLLLVGGSLIVVAVIIATHRVAGPMFRFDRALKNMIRGNLAETIRLRDKDEGRELAAQLNAFNASLSGKIREINRSSKAIADLLARCEALGLLEKNPAEVAEIFNAVKKHNDKIKSQTDFFTLKE